MTRFWLIAGLITILTTNGMTGCAVHRYVTSQWEAEKAQAKNDALEEKARLEAAYRAKETAQAETTRDLEADYVARLQAADAGRDAFGRAVADRVRQAENRACERRLSAAADRPGGPENPAAGSDPGLGSVDLEAVQRVRAVGLKLQETVRLCHEWATSVGR